MAKKERVGREQYPAWYQQWTAMARRCGNKKNRDYPNYGAKGIKVCKEWTPEEDKGYLNYVNWILTQPNHAKLASGWVVSRIDMTGDYSPENCDICTRQTSSQRRLFVRITAETVAEVRRLVRKDPTITLKTLVDQYGFGTEACWSRALSGKIWTNANEEAPLDKRELMRLHKSQPRDQHELAPV